MAQHKKPCKTCPWRRTSVRGYLGSSDALEFVQVSEAEHRMPCHETVNYDDPKWKSQYNKAPQCAGRAVFFANRFKLPRNPALLVVQDEDPEVFSNIQEFVDHHMPDQQAPRMQSMGPIVFADNVAVEDIIQKRKTRA